MITITKILDPFLPSASVIDTEEYDKNKKLYHYVSELPFDDKGITFIIAVNGNIIEYNKPQDLYIDVWDNSYISVCAKAEATAASLVAGAIAPLITGVTAGEFLLTAGLGAQLAYAAAYGISFLATYAAIGYGVNQLLSALTPDIPDYAQADPVYSWGELSQTNLEGVTIPYVYGTNKLSGNVINQYVDIDEDDNEILYVLMGLCDDEVDSITDIRINDQSATYYEDTTTEVRLGTNSDAIIDGFDELVHQTDVGALLKTDIANTKTTDSDCEKIIIRISAPNGIFYYDTEGDPSTLFAVYSVKYKKSVDANYITHSVVVCGPSSKVDAVETNFVGTKVEADNGFGYKYIFDSGQTESQRQQFITDNESFFDSSNKANLGSVDSKSYITTIDDLDLDQYDVQITRINKEWEGSKENSDIYFNNFQERIKQNLIYPGLAKYGVIALATDQISGGIPSFSCLVTKSTVSVYNQDTSLYEQKSATNPAWVVYDLLVNKAGIEDSNIIWDEFNDWATWCTDNSMIINGLVVSESNYQAVIQKIAVMGRGAIIRRGIKYGVFIDKSDTTISHLFTSSSNIIKDSLNITWLAKTDIANAIEIEYTDPDRDYTRQVISIISEDFLKTDDISSKKMSIKFDAAVSEDYVKAEGIFRMNCNKWLTKTVSFDAYTDSFACTVGDLFYFQHDLPNYSDGYSGRIVEAGNDVGSPYITLDKYISLNPLETNKILIRLGDGSFVEKTLTVDSDDEALTFIVDSSFTELPTKYDIYSIGTVASIKKTYRLISVSRKDDFIRTLIGLEYIDDIYTDRSGTIINIPPWSKVAQEALNVQVNEVLSYTPNGSYKSNLNISWSNSLGENTKYNWDIYLEDITNATSPTLIKNGTTKLSCMVSDITFIVGHEYRITVVLSNQGYNATLNNQDSITIAGKLAAPSDVPGFNIYWNSINRVINFLWSHIDDIDKDHYEIRDMGDVVSGQTTWELGTKVAETTSDTVSIYIENGIDTTKYYGIKAVDTSGIYSETETVDTVVLNTNNTSLTTPTGLVLSTGSVIASDGTDIVYIQADWDASLSVDFQEFVVELEDITLGKFAEYKTKNNYYFIQTVKANTSYGIRVRAMDKGGNTTAFSSQVTITSAKDSTPPSIPTWDSSVDIVPGFKVMGLSWDKSSASDLAYYEFRRSLTGDFTGEEFVSGPINASYISDTQLEVDTLYYYQIRATDFSGNTSDWSESRSATTLQIGETDIAYNAIIANHINVSELAAISADIGTVTAGKIQNAEGTSYIDLTNNLIGFGDALSYNGVDLDINARVTFSSGSTGAANLDDAGDLISLNRTDLLYEDGATANDVYYQTTVPTDASLNELWFSSTTKLLRRCDVAGSVSIGDSVTTFGDWSVVSNSYDNTSELTDGANLGYTALWSYIYGANKPADNADVTSENTAAAILNQGYLATKSNISINDIDTTVIDGGKITTNLVDSNSIDAIYLSGIISETGTLTVNTDGYIRSGKTSYADDTLAGFWIENNSGTPRVNIGNSVNSLKWTGSALAITGDIITSGNIQTNAVITDKILDNAVTDTEGVAGILSASTPSTYVASGNSLSIMAFVQVVGDGFQDIVVTIKEDTTTLDTYKIYASERVRSITPHILRAPAAGWHTYSVYVTGGTVSSSDNKCNIIIINLKK